MRVSIPTSRRPGGRRLGALAGGVLLAAFAAMPVAHAIAASGAEPAHGSPPLLDPVTKTLPGKRVGLNVCEFTSTLTVRRGEPPVREDVVAVDDATCTATVRRGTPAEVGPEGPAEPGETVADGRGTPAANAVATRSRRAKARAAATIHSAGYHKSYFEDPPGIDVNSVRNNVDWRWNGVRVSDGFCEWHHGWFAGWERREHNFFCRYENEQRQLRSSSFVHYRNGIFCLTIDAHTWYERNNAYGRRNGDLVGTVNWRKEGGCVGLLSFHHFLRRTLN